MADAKSSEALSRVTLDAARRDIPIELVPRSSASSLAEAAANLDIDPSRLLKTLVVKRSDDTFVFALIPGGRKLDWAKIRATLNVNKLSLPTAEVALSVTHYVRGTITPFGSHTVLPLLIDASVFQQPASAPVALGSGDPLHAVMVLPQDLADGFNATIADISTPESP